MRKAARGSIAWRCLTHRRIRSANVSDRVDYCATAEVADCVPGVTVIASCGDVGGVMIDEPNVATELTVIVYAPVGVPVLGIGPCCR